MDTRANLKPIVRGAYDIQKLRIHVGNRIVANFKTKLGQAPGESEDTLDEDASEILAILRASYRKLTDGVKTFPRQGTFTGDEVISSYTELCLLAQYLELEKAEGQHFRRLGNILKGFPIWTEWLEGVSGVGPAMAGVLISEIDIHKARYPSSLWRYAGLDVARDGKGRSRRAEHLVDREYVAADGSQATRKSITFNSFLKTKLVGVLGPCFLRAKDGPYKRAYYDYKHRLENHETYRDASKAHRHNMAIRYAVKRFLADLYVQWRTLEGLDIAPDYHEAKLGHKHGD
jgi:hypothetical protein